MRVFANIGLKLVSVSSNKITILNKHFLLLFNKNRHSFCFLLLLFLNACNSDNNAPIENKEEQQSAEEISGESPLPVFSVNTSGAEIVNEPKINGLLTVSDQGEILSEVNIGIELRGSSSLSFPKKSYGIETWDSEGEDLDVSLLGMPDEEDWILYGPYSDKSLIRNVLAYELAQGMGHYASRTQFVELLINDDKKGVYVLMEKLKRDKARININKLKADENVGEDLTGGYIIKIDKNNTGGYTAQNSFTSTYDSELNGTGNPIRFLYNYPKPDNITDQQKSYISDYVADFEDVLISEDYADDQIGYAKYIDVDSFIDFLILNEISNNVDGYRISTYLYKDKNEKLNIGPIWDFNLAFGNANYCNGGDTDVWAYQFNSRCPADGYSVPFWWNRLLEDPSFVTKLKNRWQVLRSDVLGDSEILAKIDSYTTVLIASGAVQSNSDKWPIFGVYVWPNKYIGNNYAEEITYLKQWIVERTAWLDKEITAL